MGGSNSWQQLHGTVAAECKAAARLGMSLLNDVMVLVLVAVRAGPVWFCGLSGMVCCVVFLGRRLPAWDSKGELHRQC